MLQLREGVDELAGQDLAELSDTCLAADLLAARAQMDRLDAVFAAMAVAAHRRGLGSVDGSPSTAAWLRHKAGMREGDARAAIEAGEVCDLLPDTGKAWRDGEISSGAARTIVGARVKGHDEELAACEPTLLRLARKRDLRVLQQAAAHFRKLAQADGTPPSDRDGLHISKTYGGRNILNGNFADLGGETIITALHAYTDPPSLDDTRSPAKRRADALVKICELALGRTLDDDTEPHPTHVSVVVDWDTLVHSTLGRMDGEFTGPIHPTDIRRLLCDSTISRIVTGPDGLPLDVGRSRRVISPAIRTALVERDKGCKFPGCGRPPGWCQGHHVKHWINGGITALHNSVLYCHHHHHVVHKPGWRETFDGHHHHIYRPDGTEVLE